MNYFHIWPGFPEVSSRAGRLALLPELAFIFCLNGVGQIGVDIDDATKRAPTHSRRGIGSIHQQLSGGKPPGACNQWNPLLANFLDSCQRSVRELD